LEYGIDCQKLPFFVMGTSMGGCVAIHVSMLLQLSQKFNSIYCGTILVAPLIMNRLSHHVTDWQLKGMKIAYDMGLGFLALGPGEKQDILLLKDPLMYTGAMKIGTGANLLEMELATQRLLEDVDFPFIVFHGDCDNVVSVNGSVELFQKSKTKESSKTIKIFHNAHHNLIGELKGQIFLEINQWCSSMLTNNNF